MTQLLLTLVAIQVILILVGRQFLLWYLKINQVLEVMRSIDQSLKCLPAVRAENQRLRRAS